MNMEEVTCRICRIRDDDDTQTLCKPCLCTGTIGIVHRNCLTNWIGTSGQTHCEICHMDYKLKVTYLQNTCYISIAFFTLVEILRRFKVIFCEYVGGLFLILSSLVAITIVPNIFFYFNELGSFQYSLEYIWMTIKLRAPFGIFTTIISCVTFCDMCNVYSYNETSLLEFIIAAWVLLHKDRLLSFLIILLNFITMLWFGLLPHIIGRMIFNYIIIPYVPSEQCRACIFVLLGVMIVLLTLKIIQWGSTIFSDCQLMFRSFINKANKILKFTFVESMRMIFTRILCGFWINVCTLPMQKRNFKEMVDLFELNPIYSILQHMVLGLMYNLYLYCFLLELNRILHPTLMQKIFQCSFQDFAVNQTLFEMPLYAHIFRVMNVMKFIGIAAIIQIYIPMRISQWILEISDTNTSWNENLFWVRVILFGLISTLFNKMMTRRYCIKMIEICGLQMFLKQQNLLYSRLIFNEQEQRRQNSSEEIATDEIPYLFLRIMLFVLHATGVLIASSVFIFVSYPVFFSVINWITNNSSFVRFVTFVLANACISLLYYLSTLLPERGPRIVRKYLQFFFKIYVVSVAFCAIALQINSILVYVLFIPFDIQPSVSYYLPATFLYLLIIRLGRDTKQKRALMRLQQKPARIDSIAILLEDLMYPITEQLQFLFRMSFILSHSLIPVIVSNFYMELYINEMVYFWFLGLQTLPDIIFCVKGFWQKFKVCYAEVKIEKYTTEIRIANLDENYPNANELMQILPMSSLSVSLLRNIFFTP